MTQEQIEIEKGNRPRHAEGEKSMFAFLRVILVSGFWPLISLVGVTRPPVTCSRNGVRSGDLTPT